MKVASLPRKLIAPPPWRIRMLARAKAYNQITVVLPPYTPRGIRESALRGECSDRITDLALPFIWHMLKFKKEFKHRLGEKRIENMKTLIEAANATMYTKLANSGIILKRSDSKKSRAWSENDWKKHMDYINPLAQPRPVFSQRKLKKKKWKPLPLLMPRIEFLAQVPETKMFRRLSQDQWYKDPIKVSPNALKYVISERVKVLSKPKEYSA